MFKRLIILLFLLLAPCSLLLLKAITIPKEHVFVFQRSTNSNYICYDINLQQDGKLSKKEPLKAYWVLGEGTRTEALTFLDRKMAFGVKIISTKENEAVVHLTAYKNLSIRLCKQNDKWVGIVKLHGHEIVLQKMYAKMKQSISVKCEYVDITGTDIETGEKRCERITP